MGAKQLSVVKVLLCACAEAASIPAAPEIPQASAFSSGNGDPPLLLLESV